MTYNKTIWTKGDIISSQNLNNIEEGVKSMAEATSTVYEKTIWANGDIITANKLNNIEDGIENIINQYIEPEEEDEYIFPQVPEDGKTRFYISIPKGAQEGQQRTVGFYIKTIQKQSEEDVYIDWGDGSEYSAAYASTGSPHNHTYLNPGNYIITIHSPENTLITYGTLYGGQLFGNYSDSTAQIIIDNILKKAFLGRDSVASSGLFLNYGQLTEVTIVPGASTELYSSIFSQCQKLKKVTLHEGITTIGNNCFYHCSKLTTIEIPSTVTTISSSSFSYSGIENVILHEGITNLQSLSGINIKTIDIPSTVVEISSGCFSYCMALTDIILPETIINIYEGTFSGCQSLKNITISQNVEFIGENAFSYCTSLKSITIPQNVAMIGASAFDSCYNIEEFHFLAETPPVLDFNVFLSTQYFRALIYVPANSVQAYKAAENWSTYADFIVAEPEN